MPPRRLVKDPVPPPAETDIYLFVDRHEAYNAPGQALIDKLLAAGDGRHLEPKVALRLTRYDQRFLRRFGIRVP